MWCLFSWETLALLASLVALTRYYIHRKWQYLREMNIPHDPPSLRQFGHMVPMKRKAFTYDNEMKQKYGPIWGCYNFFTPSITFHDPDILRQIQIKQFHSFPTRKRSLAKITGKQMNQRLTAAEGPQWKRIRSSLSPTFSTSKLRHMTYIMDRCVDNTAVLLNRRIEINGGVFKSRSLFLRLSLDIMCSAAFGTDVNSQDDSVPEPEIIKQAKDMFATNMFNPMLLLCMIFPSFEWMITYFNISLFARKSVTYFTSLVNQVIRQRKEDPTLRDRVDILQLMLENEISEENAKSEKFEKGMESNEIVGNSILMILAGYETTGGTMNVLAYSLAQNPDVQEKLQNEIDETFRKSGKFDYDNVNNMKYLEMCVNETLRLYGTGTRNMRLCDEQITIKGFTIPKGTMINIPSYALAHDPEYWDEPMLFNPERMRDMSQIDPLVYQPFGAGPRNCIAMRFALTEIKFTMAKLLRQFTFKPAEDTPMPPLKLREVVGIQPAVEFNLRVVKRNHE